MLLPVVVEKPLDYLGIFPIRRANEVSFSRFNFSVFFYSFYFVFIVIKRDYITDIGQHLATVASLSNPVV